MQRGTRDPAREAEPLLGECLEIRIETIPDGWRVSNTRSMLGGAILATAGFDGALPLGDRVAHLHEAEPLLLERYAGLKDDPDVPTPAQAGGDRRREALERVVRFYQVWDRVEPGKGHDTRAADWKSKLDAATLPQPTGE